MSLSVQIPITLTDSMLSSSSVAEADYTEWSGATTYAVGDKVISLTTHRIYESAAAANLNKDPTDIANRTGTTIWWVDIAPTNKWAMFDAVNNTQTIDTSPIIVAVLPGVCNSVYFGNLDATSLHILSTDATSGAILYDSGEIFLDAPPDYYEYFFDPIIEVRNYLMANMTPHSNALVTVTITNNSDTAKIGILSFGEIRPLGRTTIGASLKPKTYSYINTDAFGNTTIVRRKATTDMSVSATGDLIDASTVATIIQEVLDVPCVWIANDECTLYDGLIVFGLGSGEITYVDSVKYQLSINVQGLI